MCSAIICVTDNATGALLGMWTTLSLRSALCVCPLQRAANKYARKRIIEPRAEHSRNSFAAQGPLEQALWDLARVGLVPKTFNQFAFLPASHARPLARSHSQSGEAPFTSANGLFSAVNTIGRGGATARWLFFKISRPARDRTEGKNRGMNNGRRLSEG